MTVRRVVRATVIATALTLASVALLVVSWALLAVLLWGLYE